ncbi:MAG TPA: Dickkopf N-terminal cysteine-rich domain-containing protein [bacterium]|nr:Dickkopf N-terminal cysteine-rich domain-containing protein [bacterium]
MSERPRMILTGMLVLALMLGACEGTKSEKAKMPVDEFFQTYLQTICGSAAEYSGGIITSANKDSCVDSIKESLLVWDFFHTGRKTVFKQKIYLLRLAEKREWLSVDADQAQKCFDIISQMHPYNPLEIRLFDIPDCALAFKGLKIINDQCFQDEECDNGWCNLAAGACPGWCVLYRRQGEPCNENLDRCEPGYTCLSSGCSRLSTGAKGEPCMSDDHCASYLYCKKTEGDDIGICFEKKGIGKTCAEDNECIVGLTCIDEQCQGPEIPNSLGADCSASKVCNYFSRLECGVNGETYACRAFPAEEYAACTLQCDKKFYCDPFDHKCSYFKGEGEPCGQYYQCSTLYCAKGGVCEMPECEQIF